MIKLEFCRIDIAKGVVTEIIEIDKEFKYDNNNVIINREIKDRFFHDNELCKELIDEVKSEAIQETDLIPNEFYIFYKIGDSITENFIYCALKNKENIFKELFTVITESIKNFNGNFENNLKIDEYIFYIDCFKYILSNINIELYWKDMNYIKDYINRIEKVDMDIEDKTLYIRKFLTYVIYSSLEKQEDENNTDEYSKLINVIENKTIEEFNKNIPLFYKRIFVEEKISEFDIMLDIISSELKNYDINITYCEKIINFINNEFSKNGVFPTDLIFIKQFLLNASWVMILTITKLYCSNVNLDKKDNFGFYYLKTFVNKNCINDSNVKQKINKMLGGDVKSLLKQVKVKMNNMEEIRNKLIAHYDIKQIEDIKKIKLDLQVFKDIYEDSVRIFEILSLNKYNRDTNSRKLIKAQGFKSIICQMSWMHNPNPSSILDIDRYFDSLRKNFINNLKTIE